MFSGNGSGCLAWLCFFQWRRWPLSFNCHKNQNKIFRYKNDLQLQGLGVRTRWNFAKLKKVQTEFANHMYSWITEIKNSMLMIIWLYLESHERDQMSFVIITKCLLNGEYNTMVKVGELIGTTECLKIGTRCWINWMYCKVHLLR